MVIEKNAANPRPPQKLVAKMGLRPGWASDLCTKDEKGRPWDFSDKATRNRAVRKVVEDEPLFIIGSPPCTDWSTLMNLNWDRMDPDVVAERKKAARVHLEFCAKLYKLQHRAGRHFLHEHPRSASSWHEETITDLCQFEGVLTVTAVQCRYGLTAQDPEGKGPAQKPTRFMTNSPCVANQLQRKCPNRMTHAKSHKHVPLLNGRAKAAQKYPTMLCRAICKGIVQQIQADRQGQFLIAAIRAETAQEARAESDKLLSQINLAEEPDHPELGEAFDDVSGAPLDPNKVFEARMEEVEFIRGMGLYDKVPVEECWKNTCKGPISTTWIDINKGDDKAPNYRSRNVAREIAYKNIDGLFAATPPLKVMKLLLSVLASGNKGERLMVADVKRAYFHAKCKRLTYVKLPPEDILPGEEDMCGRLNYSMYGTRDAAANWSEEYADTMVSMGFQAGKATPCVFYHAKRGLRAYVHGDDFVVVGMPEDLNWMREEMEQTYEFTVKTLGPDSNHEKEVRVLNRILRWTDMGIEYEADPRHVEIVLKQLNIEACKPAMTPGTKDEGHAKTGDQADRHVDEKLDEIKHGAYRALVARANYLSPDRPDIAFAPKELARAMS